MGNCWNNRNNVAVSTSRILNAGNGLFVLKDYKIGDIIVLDRKIQYLINDYSLLDINVTDCLIDEYGYYLLNQNKYLHKYKKYYSSSLNNRNCIVVRNENNKNLINLVITKNLKAGEELYKTYNYFWIFKYTEFLNQHSKLTTDLYNFFNLSEILSYESIKDLYYKEKLKIFINFKRNFPNNF